MFVHCFLHFSVLPAVNNDNCVSTLLLPLLHLPDKIHNPNSRVRQSRVWPINVLELSHCARFLKLNTNQSINQSLNLSVSQSFRPSVRSSVHSSVSRSVSQSVSQSINQNKTNRTTANYNWQPQRWLDRQNEDVAFYRDSINGFWSLYTARLPPLVSDHPPKATTHPKHHDFRSEITSVRTSRRRPRQLPWMTNFPPFLFCCKWPLKAQFDLHVRSMYKTTKRMRLLVTTWNYTYRRNLEIAGNEFCAKMQMCLDHF